MSVKRYESEDSFVGLEESKNGSFVDYESYQKLEAENAALKARVAELEAGSNNISKDLIEYPRDLFVELMHKSSPYAFYLLQWVPYQTDAKQWRLKMCHDVKTFDGREAFGIWPNGNSCGPFKDDEVEFIRISRQQHGIEWKDPRDPANEA